MRRDPDLLRLILAELEDCPEPTWPGEGPLAIDGYPRVTVAYHVKLLHEAGLLRALDFSDSAEFDWRPAALTHAGHEFLGTARRDSTWKRAKNLVLRKTGGLSLEVLAKVLKDLALGQLGG